MNLIYRSKLMAKVAGIASTATLAAVMSLPAMAQSMTPNGQNSRGTENLGPSAVPGQTLPGPSESPSGSPSVPSTSNQDDPNHMTSPGSTSGEQQITPNQGTYNNRMERSSTDRMNDQNNGVGGPSAVEGQSFPGASESPSGSPSVPGVSNQDDPNHNMGRSNTPTQDALNDRMDRNDSINRPDDQSGDQNDQLNGPSAVPTEGFPGPSESPSGSPSVPGVSNQDDPGNMRMSPGS